jgi:hypothetical protein
MLMSPSDRATYSDVKRRWNALASWFASDSSLASDEVGELYGAWQSIDRGIATDASFLPQAATDMSAAEQHASLMGFAPFTNALANASSSPSFSEVVTAVSVAGPGVPVAPNLIGTPLDPNVNPSILGTPLDPNVQSPEVASSAIQADQIASAASVLANPISAIYDPAGVQAAIDNATQVGGVAVQTATHAAGAAASSACRTVWGEGQWGDWACEGKTMPSLLPSASDLPWWVYAMGATAVGGIALFAYVQYRVASTVAKAVAPYAIPLAVGAVAPEALPAVMAMQRTSRPPPAAWGAYAPGTLPEQAEQALALNAVRTHALRSRGAPVVQIYSGPTRRSR